MPIEVEAPAKLNLYLGVGGRRADGYHGVETVLVALDLHDSVTVEPAAELSLVCEPDVGVPAPDNLAWRAAVALSSAVGRESSVAIRVVKRIPARAGLGGGSADGAAVIAALAAHWGIASDAPVLERVAASLGADVPFLLRGGCAVYGGRGDEFVRALPLPGIQFLLVNPGVPVPTAAAYAAFDRMLQPAAPGVRRVADALRLEGGAASLGGALFNNMTDASTGLVPEIREALALAGRSPGCEGAAMAGSGSTVFGVFDDRESAEEAVAAARGRGWWAQVARPRRGGTLDSVTGAKET